jgi:hypothetical protein
VKLIVLLAALGTFAPVLPEEECAVVSARSGEATAHRRRAVRHPGPFEPVTIDVAIGWTNAVTRPSSIGEPAARSLAESSIAHANEVLRTTGITHVTLRLVWTGLLGWDDVPDSRHTDALTWLQTDASIAALRVATASTPPSTSSATPSASPTTSRRSKSRPIPIRSHSAMRSTRWKGTSRTS